MRSTAQLLLLIGLSLGAGAVVRLALSEPGEGQGSTAVGGESPAAVGLLTTLQGSTPQGPSDPPTTRKAVLAAAESAPAAMSTDSGEPTREELAQQLRVPEPGCLEVLVLEGRAPLAGARVRVRSAGAGVDEAWLRDTLTGADGRCEALALGSGSYAVRVQHEGRVLELSARLAPRRRPETLAFVFGAGAIEGAVWDADAQPTSGAMLRLRADGPRPDGTAPRSTMRTGADGRFRFAGLASGDYVLSVERAGGTAGIGGDVQRISLGRGETRALDFGRSYAPGRLRGALVDAAGAAVVGARRVELRDPASGETLVARTLADGTFDVPLPEGTWSVRVACSARPAIELGAVEMGRADQELSLRVPGPVVVVHVRSANEAWSDAEAARRVELRLVRAGERRGLRPDAHTDDARRWYGPAPGDYELRAQGSVQLVGEPGRSVRVGEDDGELRLEVAVR